MLQDDKCVYISPPKKKKNIYIYIFFLQTSTKRWTILLDFTTNYKHQLYSYTTLCHHDTWRISDSMFTGTIGKRQFSQIHQGVPVSLVVRNPTSAARKRLEGTVLIVLRSCGFFPTISKQWHSDLWCQLLVHPCHIGSSKYTAWFYHLNINGYFFATRILSSPNLSKSAVLGSHDKSRGSTVQSR